GHHDAVRPDVESEDVDVVEDHRPLDHVDRDRRAEHADGVAPRGRTRRCRRHLGRGHAITLLADSGHYVRRTLEESLRRGQTPNVSAPRRPCPAAGPTGATWPRHSWA